MAVNILKVNTIILLGIGIISCKKKTLFVLGRVVLKLFVYTRLD